MIRTAPEWLGKPGVRAWSEAVESVEALGCWGAAERYAWAVDIAHALRDEWLALGRPYLARGGKSGMATVPHPLLEAMGDAFRTASRFGGELGLDPQSRKRLRAARGRPQERAPMRPISAWPEDR